MGHGLTERPCEICGAAELEPLWRFAHTTETTAGPQDFDVRVALCRRCAFVLASPAPTQAALDAYYATAFAAAAAPDFSVDARIELLASVAGGRLVEVGANAPGPFSERSAALFDDRVAVEPIAGVERDHAAVDQLEPGGADVVAHYFVLEHVRDARAFLRACRRALRSGGVMVCEVPDLHLYPRDASALRWHEHVNHFSPVSLARLAGLEGLVLERVDHRLCSRPFGFAAVFRAGAPVPAEPAPLVEVSHARSCVAAGAAVISTWTAQLDATRRAVVAAGERAVLWAANDVLAELLAPLSSVDATIVDASPAKRELRGLPVVRPDADLLAAADLLVICTPHHAEAIRAEALRLRGGTLPREIVVLGPPVR